MVNRHFMLQQLLKSSASSHAHVRHRRLVVDHTAVKQSVQVTALQVADLLEKMITRRARGESFASIAADLNKQGVCGGYGCRWYAGSVRAYMQRHS